MSVTSHPSIVLDTRKITINAGTSNDDQLISGTLKHGALAQPFRFGVTLNLYPCVGVGQVEVRDVDGIGG